MIVCMFVGMLFVDCFKVVVEGILCVEFCEEYFIVFVVVCCVF